MYTFRAAGAMFATRKTPHDTKTLPYHFEWPVLLLTVRYRLLQKQFFADNIVAGISWSS
jgi:hypothetical protein